MGLHGKEGDVALLFRPELQPKVIEVMLGDAVRHAGNLLHKELDVPVQQQVHLLVVVVVVAHPLHSLHVVHEAKSRKIIEKQTKIRSNQK